MANSIDFYFDFSSPYGYLASTRIEAIAERYGRAVNWHPILLGAIFKVSGQAPLTTYPLRGEYAIHDFARAARENKTPYKQPDPFPVSTVAAARACCWIKQSNDSSVTAKLAPFVHATFKAYYVEGRNISEPDNILEIAESLDINKAALAEGLADQSIKDALKDAINQAMEVGVFGSPTTVIDGELFWGSDRLEQVDRWLSRGGW